MSENDKLVAEKDIDMSEDAIETDELEEVLESVPPEQRKIIEKMMVASFQMRTVSASPENAVMKKLTQEHITMFLDGSKLEMENGYREKKYRKIFMVAIVFMVLVFFIGVIVLLKDIPDIMEKVIYTVGAFVMGLVGGYGAGKNKRDDD